MRFKIYTLITWCLLFSVNAAATHEIMHKSLRAHVNFLSSEALGGRLTGSEGEKLATEYVATTFKRLGLEPAGDNGTFYQTFRFTAGVKKNTQSGRNVLAKLKVGSGAAPILVVGAHVDHLGHGEVSGSRARNNEAGMMHPGADDNASGVASMLEVAASLSDLKARGKLLGNKTILFAAWSGEEVGVQGSSHFVAHFKKTPANRPLRNIDAVINLDMVGRLKENLVLQGVGSSTDWLQLLNKIKPNHPIAFITQSDPYLPTDSMPFYLHGVPTLNFFTGAHDEYHTPRDKPDTLNYVGMKNIAKFLVDLVLMLEDQPGILNYQAVQKTSDHHERGFKIYLGTIPDYGSADVSGVKLAGVAKKSPAECAGIKQGDVITQLAGKRIHDIYDYTFALNKLPVGKPVTLVVQRAQTNVMLTIVPRYRD